MLHAWMPLGCVSIVLCRLLPWLRWLGGNVNRELMQLAAEEVTKPVQVIARDVRAQGTA